MKYDLYSVYMHTAPNGKKYIGITCNTPSVRWANGKNYRGNPYFTNAVQKYGWDSFTHEIIFSGLSKIEAEQKEIELIALYDTTNREKGFNISEGGNAPMSDRKHSKESRSKISDAVRRQWDDPETRVKRIIGAKRAFSKPAVREKLCLARKKSWDESPERKRQLRLSHMKPVFCLELCAVYPSQKSAESANHCRISDCLNGRRKTAGGFHWIPIDVTRVTPEIQHWLFTLQIAELEGVSYAV